jgi:hypothetical protein
MYGNGLARTGMGAIAAGGLTITGEWLVAAAALMVLSGTALVRLGFRRERPQR